MGFRPVKDQKFIGPGGKTWVAEEDFTEKGGRAQSQQGGVSRPLKAEEVEGEGNFSHGPKTQKRIDDRKKEEESKKSSADSSSSSSDKGEWRTIGDGPMHGRKLLIKEGKVVGGLPKAVLEKGKSTNSSFNSGRSNALTAIQNKFKQEQTGSSEKGVGMDQQVVNKSHAYEEGYLAGQRGYGDLSHNPFSSMKESEDWIKGYSAGCKKVGRRVNSTTNSLTRGRERALATIQNKCEQVGISLVNESPGKAGMNAAQEDVLFQKAGITATDGQRGTFNLLLRGKLIKSDIPLTQWRVEARKLINSSETVVFSESGYKIVVTIGDCSGACTLITPQGQRIPHNTAADARKEVVTMMKEAGSYGTGTKVGNSNLTSPGMSEYTCRTKYEGDPWVGETFEEGRSQKDVFERLKKRMWGGKLPIYVEVVGLGEPPLKWGNPNG